MYIPFFAIRFKALFIFTIAINFSLSASFQEVIKDTTKTSYEVKELVRQKKYEDALTLSTKALNKELKKTTKDSLEIASIYYQSVEAFQKLGENLEVKKNCDKGISYCPNTQEGLQLKGMLYYKKAYPKGDMLLFGLNNIKSMEKALNIFSQLQKPDWDFILGGYRFLAEGMASRGNFEAAERYHQLFAKLFEKLKKSALSSNEELKEVVKKYRMIVPYNKVNINFTKKGNDLKDSLKMMEALGELERNHIVSEFDILSGGIYYTHGLYCIADWYLMRKASRNLKPKDIEKALEYIDKAIYLVEKENYPGNIFQYNYVKCKALTQDNKLAKAEVIIDDLIEKFKKNLNRPFFLAQKGLIKIKIQQKDSALLIFNQVIKSISGNEDLKKDYSNFKPTDNFGHTKLILRIAEELKNYYGKDPDVKDVIAKLYHIGFIQFENSYVHAQFNTTYHKLLSQISEGILTEKKNNEKSINEIDFLNRIETIRNQLAWKSFSQNRFSDNLVILDSLQARKLQLKGLLIEAKSKNKLAAKDSLDALLDKTQRFTYEVFPNLNLLAEKPFDLRDLQQNLRKNERIIKYLLFDSHCAIYTIDAESISLNLIKWGKQEKELIKTYVAQIKKKQYNTEIAEKLAKLLLPISKNGITHLIINPDGELYRIPFETLKIQDKLLIDTYDISYTSNLAFIHPLEMKKANEKNLAIYVPEYGNNSVKVPVRSGNWVNLEGAKEEANIISQLFPSTIYRGETLSKKDFLNTAPKADLIHLAMHVQVDNNIPGLSHLVFGNESNENEQNLYLDELYELRLKANLAVLSACNTGVGKENSGQGMESFQRAFTFAGVPATVASLWEVPDIATKEIIVSFYKNLNKGLNKSQALRKAKLKFRDTYANTELEESFYWAGFVVYGEYEPITEKSNSFLAFLPILIGILLATTLILFFRKQLKLPPIFKS